MSPFLASHLNRTDGEPCLCLAVPAALVSDMTDERSNVVAPTSGTWC
jgi:hypothetical protein